MPVARHRLGWAPAADLVLLGAYSSKIELSNESLMSRPPKRECLIVLIHSFFRLTDTSGYAVMKGDALDEEPCSLVRTIVNASITCRRPGESQDDIGETLRVTASPSPLRAQRSNPESFRGCISGLLRCARND